MKKNLLFASLLAFTASFTLFAKGDTWVFLGDRTVSFRTENDTIPVGAHDGIFRKIKLKVTKNAIRIVDLKIHFANGDVQDVGLRSVIRAGGETRIIDLSGTQRVITKVTLRYESLNQRKGKAKVQLFARH